MINFVRALSTSRSLALEERRSRGETPFRGRTSCLIRRRTLHTSDSTSS